MVGTRDECIPDDEFVCRCLQRELSSGPSRLYSTSLVAKPKWLEEFAQQFALNHSTSGLLQLAPAVAESVPKFSISNEI